MGGTVGGDAAMKYYVEIDGQEFEIEIGVEGQVTVDGSPVSVNMVRIPGQNVYSLLVDHRSFEVAVEEIRGGYRILLLGEQYDAKVQDERVRRLMAGREQPAPISGDLTVRAPIPGLVVRVHVHPGEEVAKDQPLLILQAMKMDNEIRAPRDGTVRDVHVSEGQSVEQNEPLVTLS